MTTLAHTGAIAGEPAQAAPMGFRLEPGETVLWQGRPASGALRRHLFKARWLTAYFVALLTWKSALIVGAGGLRPQEVADATILVAEGAALLGLLTFYAWALARSTTYTVTDLRVVIRHGIALPATVDIPLRALRSVAVRVHDDGSGDVALGVRADGGIGYAKVWPHVRGWSLSRPVPMLRGLTDAARISAMLTRRLGQVHDTAARSGGSNAATVAHAA